MEHVLPFPLQRNLPLERDMAEVATAISMVARGAAIRVRLVNLRNPDAVAGDGAARASQAGVEFRLDRSEDAVRIIVGPRR